MYQVFLCVYYDAVKHLWVAERYYYKVDITKINLTTDWRFKAIPHKRQQLIHLGTSTIICK